MIASFESRLKLLRKEKKISQEQLAYHMEVSRSTVASWETGKRYPTPSALRKLAIYFNVSSDYLYGRCMERRNIVASPMYNMDLTKLNPNGLHMLAETYRLLVNDEKYRSD